MIIGRVSISRFFLLYIYSIFSNTLIIEIGVILRAIKTYIIDIDS